MSIIHFILHINAFKVINIKVLFLVICEDDIDGKGMHMLLLLETLSITTLYTYITYICTIYSYVKQLFQSD